MMIQNLLDVLTSRMLMTAAGAAGGMPAGLTAGLDMMQW
jgi:hypothetical protein